MPERQMIAAHFNRAAHVYDAHAHLQQTVAATAGEWLTENVTAGSLVLDAGAGTGWLARQHPEYQWLLLDHAEAMCQQAQPYGKVLCGDVRSLPLQAHSVDAYISTLCWQWAEPLPQAIEEMQRVLRSNGVGVIATLVRPSFADLHHSFHALRLPSRLLTYHHADSITSWLRAVGMDIIQHEQCFYPVRHQNTLALLRSLKAIGAVATASQTALTPRQLRQLIAYHDAMHKHHMDVKADYHIGFWLIQKKQ